MNNRIAVIIGGFGSEINIPGNTHYQNTESAVSAMKKLGFLTKLIAMDDPHFIKKIKEYKPHAAYLTVYGKKGEDGTLQGLMNLLKIKYIGTGVLGSALGNNKQKCKEFLDKLNSPRGVIVKDNKSISSLILKANLKLPLIVKPNDSGSSYGVYLCETIPDLTKRSIYITNMLGAKVLIEEFIDGQEATIYAMRSKGQIHLFPIITVAFRNGEKIYNHKIKFDKIQRAGIKENILSSKIREKIRAGCLYIYEKLECRGLVRVDFRIRKDAVYFLEINTIPGVRNSGCLREALEMLSWTYEDLIKLQIEEAAHD